VAASPAGSRAAAKSLWERLVVSRAAATLGTSSGPLFKSIPAGDIARIKTRVRAHLRQDGAGRVSYRAFANVIHGRVPG
jgi:hypothetical protein